MTGFWVDIDNPPQAQYLSPIARALRGRGHSVLITARDHPQTLEVLANRELSPIAVGGTFGASSLSKALGTLGRAVRLRRLVRHRMGRPSAAVTTSRSGAVAARLLAAPAFTVLDYEGVELGVFRRSGTTLLHPAVVPATRFRERGFPASRLRSFPGLKEDLTFSGIDPDAVEAAELPFPRDPSLPAVLIRPPSETSHYRADHSIVAMSAVLDGLARRDDVQVILAPREPAQVEAVMARTWTVPPVVLQRALPFAELLGAVDWVVTGGGTMLREAAWLGVPGVSVFQGETPAVDEWLEDQGAIQRIGSREEADSIDWAKPRPHRGVTRHPEALENVIEIIENGARVADGDL